MVFFGLEDFCINFWIMVGISVFIITGPVVSLIWLLFFFCIGSVLMIILGIDYIAFLLIVVYAGAVIILFLFITMFLNVRSYENFDFKYTNNWIILVFFLVLIFFFYKFFWFNEFIYVYYNVFEEFSLVLVSFLNFSVHLIYFIGFYIFDYYFFIFFFLGILLFVGMEGVLYLVLDFLKFLYFDLLFVGEI